ncbi:glycosyltransferase [Trichococcus shcherbakoviae]|uniref:glycosyltransferase n=1 Tax=Trichococcus shcherbakoviae TaxID=2094020 RepID=UPI0029F4EAB3|nr:glycosyltransferase [Trichococcus shcherbakoviae]
MKKVLFLIPSLSHGGAEKVLVNLVNNLDEGKYDITVKTILDIGINKQYLANNIKYKSIFKKNFRGSTWFLKLFPLNLAYRLFVEDGYDIEIAYLEGASVRLISEANEKYKSKKIAWIHTEFYNESDLAIGFRNYKEGKKCYENLDQIICVSDMVMKGFMKVSDVGHSIKVLYNTIETRKIREISNELVSDIKFNPDIINICSVGKIIPSKNFIALARIHKKLLDEGLENHFYILGIGPEQKNIEAFLEQNGIKDSFTFLGYKDNPYKYVSKCDLYVCSSLREGYSTAVTESLIVGTPVVTTLCSGMKEMLGENNEYGIITENNEVALYEGIRQMLNDPGLLNYYKRKAIERGDFFSTERTVEAVEELLDNLSEE